MTIFYQRNLAICFWNELNYKWKSRVQRSILNFDLYSQLEINIPLHRLSNIVCNIMTTIHGI